MRSLVRALLAPLPKGKHPSLDPKGIQLMWRYGWIKAEFIYRPLWALKSAFSIGPKITMGHRVSIQGCVRARGPGAIHVGDDVILSNQTDLYTHSKEATISIGARSFLNGPRMGCSVSISIGDDCILADARLMDTDFHSIAKDRQQRTAVVKSAPISVGQNVWIAAGSGILKGVTIGRDSVIAFQSVVTSAVPEGRIFAGNPARDVGPVPETSERA